MKNADMPAIPMFSDNAEPRIVRDPETGKKAPASGLTKREMVAMHMMAARVSVPGAPDDEFDAKRAVAATDALLAYLERACQKT